MDVCPFSFSSLAERKTTQYPILYYEIYKWKMKHAPKNVNRFCDPRLEDCKRKDLVQWIRNIEDKTSCQHLQILFSFSVPNSETLEKIKSLRKLIVSAGAGNGYWEYLLLRNGVDIVAFDNNSVYPESMHYMNIQNAEPNVLEDFSDRILLLAWPDQDEESSFSIECLKHYKGDTVIHIGELFGETLSHNPWGQTTSRTFQLELAKSFRCVYRSRLPNWPGHLDSLSIWCKIMEPIECNGGMFCYVPGLQQNDHEEEDQGYTESIKVPKNTVLLL